ncbi:unnamed protein product [Closterium sp. NIES-54]
MAVDYLTKKLPKGRFEYCMLLTGLDHAAWLAKPWRDSAGRTSSSRTRELAHGDLPTTGWYTREPAAPPVPPEPPTPPAPPAPPVPPAPPAPPNPPDIGASAHQRPVLQLYLPATFDEWLSETDTPKAPDVFIQVPPPAPWWGQPEACTWDESAVGADDDVAADKEYSSDDDGVGDGEADAEEDVLPDRGASAEDDDGVESWWRDAPREKMPIPTYPPINKNDPTPPPRTEMPAPPLPGTSRLNINGRPTPPRRNSDVATQCKEFWQFVRNARNEYAIDNRYIINADQMPLWLEMPATTTVEQTGVKSVPIRSAGYQKERVTVMLAWTATGEKLKPWVFFKRKTLPKGDFPNDAVVGCQANGWMEATGVIQWLDEGVVPFLKPKFGVQSRSCQTHIT